MLEESGYDSLSVKTICREAGVNKNMVVYHFGSKNGLLVALVEWLLYEIGWNLRVMSTARDGTRESVLRTSVEEYLGDLRAARLFFDLFPRLVEDPSMAIPLRELYRTLRESHVRGIWGDDLGQAPNVVRRLAAMSIALVDGLAVQAITEPGSVEVAPTLALWWSLVDGALASARQADQPVS